MAVVRSWYAQHTLDADFAPQTFAWFALYIVTILSYIGDSIP